MRRSWTPLLGAALATIVAAPAAPEETPVPEDPAQVTSRRIQDLAGFMRSFHKLFGGYPAAPDLASINEPSWHGKLHYWRYDGRLCPDPLPTQDGWERPLGYRALGSAREVHVPHSGMSRPRAVALDVALAFEIRSLGADGIPGNSDDLILTDATIDATLGGIPERQVYAEWGLAELYNILFVEQAIGRYQQDQGQLPTSWAQLTGHVDAELTRLRYSLSTDGASYTITHGWRDEQFGTADDVVFQDGLLVRIPESEIPRILEQAHDACGPMSAARSLVHDFCDAMPDRMLVLAAKGLGGLPIEDRLLIMEFLFWAKGVEPGAFQLFLSIPNDRIRRAAADQLATFVIGKQRHYEREWATERAGFEPLIDLGRKLLADPDPSVAESAALFLAIMTPDTAIDAARAAHIPEVGLLQVMEVIGDRRYVEDARARLHDPSWEVRLADVRALGACGGAAEALRALDDPDVLVRAQALASAMEHFDDPLSEDVVRKATAVATEIWRTQPELVAGLASSWLQRHAPDVWRTTENFPLAAAIPAAEPARDEATQQDEPSLASGDWDHRLEAPLLLRWRQLWSNPSEVALDGAHAAELAEVLRNLVLCGGDDASSAIAGTLAQLRTEGQPSATLAPLARAIGLIGAPPGQAVLGEILRDLATTPDGALEDSILDALWRGGVADPDPVLEYAARTSDGTRRQRAFFALGTCRGPEAIAMMRDALASMEDTNSRGSLLTSIAKAGGQHELLPIADAALARWIPYLLADPPHQDLLLLLSLPQSRLREVIVALGSIRHPDAAWHLLRLLDEAELDPRLVLTPGGLYERRLQGPRGNFECGGVLNEAMPAVDPVAARRSLARIYPLIHSDAIAKLRTPRAGRDLHLALMLEDLEPGSVRDELTASLLQNPHAAVRLAAMSSLGSTAASGALRKILDAAYDADPSPRVRLMAAKLLGNRASATGMQVRQLPPPPSRASTSLSLAEATALAESGLDEDVSALVAALGDPASIIAAADALGITRDGRATSALLRALDGLEDLDQGRPFAKVCDAIGQIGDPAATQALLEVLRRIAPRGWTGGAQAVIGAILRIQTDSEDVARVLWDVHQSSVPDPASSPAPRSLREPTFWALVELRSRLVLGVVRDRVEHELAQPYTRPDLNAAWPDLVGYLADVEGAPALEPLLAPQQESSTREIILRAIGKDPVAGCRVLSLATKLPWTVEWNVIASNMSPAWLPCLERWLVPPQTPGYSGLSYLAQIGTERAAEILAITLAAMPLDANEARLPLDPLEPVDPYYDVPNKTYSGAARAAFLRIPLTHRRVPWLATHPEAGARLQAALLLDSLPPEDTCAPAALLLEDTDPLVRYAAVTRIQAAALHELRARLEAIVREDPSLRVRRAAARRLAAD